MHGIVHACLGLVVESIKPMVTPCLAQAMWLIKMCPLPLLVNLARATWTSRPPPAQPGRRATWTSHHMLVRAWVLPRDTRTFRLSNLPRTMTTTTKTCDCKSFRLIEMFKLQVDTSPVELGNCTRTGRKLRRQLYGQRTLRLCCATYACLNN